MVIETLAVSRLTREWNRVLRNLGKGSPVTYEVTIKGKAVGNLISHDRYKKLIQATESELRD